MIRRIDVNVKVSNFVPGFKFFLRVIWNIMMLNRICFLICRISIGLIVVI